ncbi:MAG: hypothetical protein HYV07_09125 [Deltaproteobacteria bacterium]|nr:hypothetical protein [Deltaproteobacteria bacterium]
MDVVLAHLGVEDTALPADELFWSATCVSDRAAIICVAKETKELAHRRSAQASALGRLLFESRPKSWGAALGYYSRWVESRRAKAFAAELLAPIEVVRQRYIDSPAALVADFGLTPTSAEWRIHARQHGLDTLS